MNQIKSIQTRYAGCHFRSRLEARWAVFFDAMGIRWEYEPETFVGCHGEPYLPDFFLPELRCPLDLRRDCQKPDVPVRRGVYVEVKGSDEQLEESSCRIGSAIDWGWTKLSHHGLLILGSIPRIDNLPKYCLVCHHIAYWREGVSSDVVFFSSDGALELADGVSTRFAGSNSDCLPPQASTKPAIFYDYPPTPRKTQKSYNAARSARFEHGQHGAT